MTFGSSPIFTGGRFSAPFDFHLPGGIRRVKGIFDNAFFDRNFGENSLETTTPRILADIEHVGDVGEETMVECISSGKWFSVVQIQPDGTGMAVVVLAHDDAPGTDTDEE